MADKDEIRAEEEVEPIKFAPKVPTYDLNERMRENAEAVVDLQLSRKHED